MRKVSLSLILYLTSNESRWLEKKIEAFWKFLFEIIKKKEEKEVMLHNKRENEGKDKDEEYIGQIASPKGKENRKNSKKGLRYQP